MVELEKVVSDLERHYGKPKPPRPTDPFQQIVFENASYLVDDERRAQVFDALAEKIGTTPEAILGARQSELVEVIRDGGMRPPMRAGKLIAAARIAKSLDAPLSTIVKRPLSEAKRALKKFPGIGEPGAEKLALFAGAHPVLGLESNGLRVLVRLGFGSEHKSYDRTWRSVRDELAGELPRDIRWLQRAHQLLRRHGQELCKRTHPLCGECPLARECPSAPRR